MMEGAPSIPSAHQWATMPRVCPQCHEQFDDHLERCPADGTPLEVRVRPGSADPLIGQLLAERYRIQRTLGEGGMGRVYLAEHERMGRLSAVKVMSPSLASTPEAISRFNREAANASRIHQPNVAAISRLRGLKTRLVTWA